MAESASKQIQQMTMENSSIDDRMKLMTRNLQEVIGEERIRDVWQKEQRPPVVYWGTAPTGKIHIAYFVPMAKLADFLKAGCKVKILLADLHAFLDAAKAPMDLLVKRTKYYEVTIKALLKAINVPIDQLEFVTGRSFQLGVPYTTDVYKLMTMMKLKDATRAGSDVVKQDKDHNPVMSCLLYPGLQALDEEHLNVDVQFGGVDQRKIFMLAEEFLPKLDYKKRAHLMNPMVPGLTGGKMSASDEKSKIGLLDTPEEVQKKLKAAFCEEGEVENNGVLAFIKYVLTTAKNLSEIVIHRDEKHGGNMTFSSYEELERAFQRKEVHPLDLKAYVAKEINELLEPIRQEFQKPEMQQLLREAYPSQV